MRGVVGIVANLVCGLVGVCFGQVEAGVEQATPIALRGEIAVGESIRAGGIVLPGRGAVDLELTRFAVHGAGLGVVVRRHGRDDAIAYDPSRVVLLRGRVAGEGDSSVFLARSDTLGVIGSIEIGGSRFGVAPVMDEDGRASLSRVRIGHSAGGGRALPCGTDTSGWTAPADPLEEAPADLMVELAVDTDYDYFEMFDDEVRALDYLFALYGQVSFVSARDSGIRVVLTFVRLWTDPNDLYNGNRPLGEFQSEWQQNMGHVHRDVAQLCSGRRDFPFGGQAFLNGVCNGAAYSVCGYMGAGLGDPTVGDHMNSDLIVAAHELGHNFGSPHTHDRGIDTCNDAFAPPQRGPIMSYCGQSYSGGDANHDARFHTDSTRLMRAFLGSLEDCLDSDCNSNGVADSVDIADGTSVDVNGNGVPDECEDCNANGVLDGEDIADGFSNDLNGNGVPDECEPDCDGNGVPDDLDIAAGDLPDLDGDGVPDGCQVDCDGNGIADRLDINADMSLDIDRDGILDGCQDCDGDGVRDIDALDHAWSVWIGSLREGIGVREFYGKTGVLLGVHDDSIARVHDLIVTADRRVLVASALDDRIVEFAPDGSRIGDLVSPGAGGLDEPGGMLAVDGRLLVTSRGTGQVLAYDLGDGSFLGEVAGGLAGPFGIAQHPSGTLLVSTADNEVLEVDADGGGVIRVVVDRADNGGLLDPRGLVVDTIGELLVCSFGSDQVLAYDLATGRPLGQFNHNGTASRLTLEEPWTIRVGPNGNVFVSNSHIREGRYPPDFLHLTQARVYEFDWHTGNYLRALVQGADTGLWRPSGFDFMPGDATDCNMNFMPDGCEIAMGLVEDGDGDGVPDECQRCEADLDGDGDADSDDFFAYLSLFGANDTRADLTGSSDPHSRSYGVPDGNLDADDFFYYLDNFRRGCGG